MQLGGVNGACAAPMASTMALDRAVIVASGPSAAGFVPPDGVTVIAVNGAIEWLARVDYWFTLDPSDANRRRWRNPRAGVQYCAALPLEWRGVPAHVQRYERVCAADSFPYEPKSPEGWMRRWRAVPRLCDEPGKIHTGNSAWGALGLAYHLGAQRVALVGVDATQEPRVEGGEPNNLSHLPMLFASALDQIELVSCGRMGGVPQMTIEEGMAWLMQ